MEILVYVLWRVLEIDFYLRNLKGERYSGFVDGRGRERWLCGRIVFLECCGNGI